MEQGVVPQFLIKSRRCRKAVQEEEEALANQRAAAQEQQEKNVEASQDAPTQSTSSASKAVIAALDPETQDLGAQQPADDAVLDTERQILKLQASESSAPAQAVAPEQVCPPSIPVSLDDDIHATTHM